MSAAKMYGRLGTCRCHDEQWPGRSQRAIEKREWRHDAECEQDEDAS